MKRISVTTLEKFRRFIDGVSSDDTEESLIESLKGLFKGNDKTDFGGAYHKIIEGEFENYAGNIFVTYDKTKQFVFNYAQAAPALSYRRNHPLMVHEVDVRKIFETTYGSIQVTGRLDGLEGATVRDLKTRFKQMNDADYADSFQWKFYLEMLGLDTFFYDVFEIKGFDALPEKRPFIMPEVSIIAHEPIKCERYKTMSEDVQSILNHFMDYIDNRQLSNLLKPAITDEPQLIF
ncbi:MAG TPA: hypothetical protein P5519_12755 [Spirochaetia bacterium]|nr:hypothetical protein [Spirochaetia bacterium]